MTRPAGPPGPHPLPHLQALQLASGQTDHGRYGTAQTMLDPLLELDGDVGAAAHAIAASGWRQLGRHDLATPHDRAGWHCARSHAVRSALAAGLAADRIGHLDPGPARGWLDTATASLGDAVPGVLDDVLEPALTCRWVATEVALLAGEPQAALAQARAAVGLALVRSAAPRAPHLMAKSLLFLGVCERDCDHPAAPHTLLQALALARSASLDPLVGPIVDVLAGTGQGPAELSAMRAEADQALTRIAADRTPGMRRLLAAPWT